MALKKSYFWKNTTGFYNKNFKNNNLRIIINIIKKTVIFVLILHLVFILVIAGFLVFYKFKDPACSMLMLYRAGFNSKNKIKKQDVSLQQIPYVTRRMILVAEDPGFFKHCGIEPESMKRAFQLNKKLGKKAYGGSTITQQLARTLFLIPVKSYLRKYLELIITLEMEIILSKDRILELYCNNIEMGKNIYGLAAGSWYYYKKPLSKLSTEEQIRLVTIVASPVKNTPYAFNNNYQLVHRYYLLQKYF